MRSPIDASIAPGVNYALKVPMDSGTLQQLYHPTALQPTMPFTIRVQIGELSYVPMEITGPAAKIGEPSDRTRLDLTLGVDSDGDGIADAWEQAQLNGNRHSGLTSIEDVKPDEDMDGDGISNFGEYIAGTYAFDWNDRLRLEIVEVAEGRAHLRFLAIRGRTYSLETSLDSDTFTPIRFSTAPELAAESAIYRTTNVEMVDLYTPVAESTNQMFFVLNVE